MTPIEKRINQALHEAKNGLFHNINKRKKSGTSRSKKNTTIDKKTYEQMRKW
jgi:hypothetical protein